MKTSTVVWIIVVILVLGAGWYLLSGSSSQSTTTQPSTTTSAQGSSNQAAAPQVAPPIVTVVHDAKLGDYLVAANGMTLYSSTKDTPGVSNCTGTCAVNWPPYAHGAGEPLVLGPGLTGVLATLTRSDGSYQVEYNGMPLYFWKNDKKPGDTTGQNVAGFVLVKP